MSRVGYAARLFDSCIASAGSKLRSAIYSRGLGDRSRFAFLSRNLASIASVHKWVICTGYIGCDRVTVEPIQCALLEPWHVSKPGTRNDDTVAFVVEDDRYISARWQGDAFLIARERLPPADGRTA